MAEFVQLRKEKWAEPLQFLRNLNLFHESEFRKINYNIENHEYKIQTPNRKLEDVLAYIEFECVLLKAIKERRKNADQYERTDEIDRFIYNEIYSQFGSAEINFQHDINYWNARLKFIATIVPPENREIEFNRIFRKALDYCGQDHLELFKDCVDFLWTFLSSTPSKVSKKKARLIKQRKNISRIMATIRDITNRALRYFPRSPETFIWVVTTELKYLTKLYDEEELSTDQIQEETEKATALVQILSDNIIEKHKEATVYFHFFDEVNRFTIPQASQLSKKIYQSILSFHPRTLEIGSWLINKSIADRRIDECLERVIQALYSTLPKLKTLSMCLEKLDDFFNELEAIGYDKSCTPKLVEFYAKLLDKDNQEWSEVSSEMYHISRIKFIERLQRLKSSKIFEGEDELSKQMCATIDSFCENNRLEKNIIQSARRFPTNFFIVKSRILQLLSLKGDSLKPAVIIKYLKGLDLRRLREDAEKQEQVCQLLYIVYYSFISSNKLGKKVDTLLKVPGTDDLRVIHMKKLYLESIDAGRSFYNEYKALTNDWKFPIAVVEIETNISRSGKLSKELLQAIEDATRIARTSSTEPWKICIMSLYHLKSEKQATELLQRALRLFSMENEQGYKHKNLLIFAKSYKL